MKYEGPETVGEMFCFLCDEKLTIKVVKDVICFSKKKNAKCIVVYREDVTASAKKSVESLDVQIELFSLKELQLNITKHRLVPLHTAATPEEVEELKNTKIPLLLASDPIVRFYRFEKGQFIRITRKNGIVVYRQVKN